MKLIGARPTEPMADTDVHTIDIWYSDDRRHWLVQRLNHAGDPIGIAHRCKTKHEADACVADWLRRHSETHMTTAMPRGGRFKART